MSGFGLENPWLLAGLAGVGVPVLIHFLTRAKPRKIVFPPFRFLMEACAGQRSLNQLRTLILLALRCCAVAALALLFARPFLKPMGVTNSEKAGQRIVVIVDASLSMHAVHQGVTLFARAQAEAADMLRSLPTGSEAAVILAGARARPLLPALSRNLAAVHESLTQAQPTFELGDINAALASAKALLAGQPGTICVFSDFQQSNWEGVSEMPANVLCKLRPVHDGFVENAAITSVRFAPSEPVVGEPAEVLCTVFNCSPRLRQETVRLQLGEYSQEARVALPAFGSADAVFQVSFPRTGWVTGQAAVADDLLKEDNTRFVAVHAQKSLKVLVASDSDNRDSRAPVFFVSRAIAPHSHGLRTASDTATSGIELISRHGQDLDRGILETADVFVLVSPATLTGDASQTIVRRVNEGAQLLVFLDGPAAQSLASPTFQPPFQLLASMKSDSGEILNPAARKLFSDTDDNDWSQIRLWRYYQNFVMQNRAQDVALTYPDGSAALTISTMGKGSVMFLNLPLTPDGGELIGSPIFPAMVHELLRISRHESSEQPVTPGIAWTLNAVTGGEGAVIVLDSAGQPVEGEVLSSGRTTRLAMPAQGKPGVFMARQANEAVGAAVVNIDARESDTRPLSLEKLSFAGRTGVTVATREGDLALGVKERPLWPQIALVLAILLTAEMALLVLWPARSSAAV